MPPSRPAEPPIAQSATFAEWAQAFRARLVVVDLELMPAPGALAQPPFAPVAPFAAIAELRYEVSHRLAGYPAVAATPTVTGTSRSYPHIPNHDLMVGE